MNCHSGTIIVKIVGRVDLSHMSFNFISFNPPCQAPYQHPVGYVSGSEKKGGNKDRMKYKRR